MINREVSYERTITGSYMKIPAGINAGLDEKLMLKRKLQGTLPVEKNYVDGSGQYWYNISGRQSLDMYCRVREIGIGFVEKLAVSICSELDILEWNLMQANCLMLDPELIFITNANQEFIFTLYPCNRTQVESEFQQLMEYLLTKINHKDEAAVQTAYRIYEMTLEEGYSLTDIRETIMKAKQREIAQEADRRLQEEGREVGIARSVEEREEKRGKRMKPKEIQNNTNFGTGELHRAERADSSDHKRGWPRFWIFLRKQLGYEKAVPEKAQTSDKKSSDKKCNVRKDKKSGGRRERFKQQDEGFVYPEEEIYVPKEEIHPTILLGSVSCALQGILLYQGPERREDIRLEDDVVRIGHGEGADVRIDSDAVSRIHARINRDGEHYYIEDLNSTNGTYVNDELLAYKERRQLAAGDEIRFANLKYRFC